MKVSAGSVIEPPRKCFDVEDSGDKPIVALFFSCDATLIVSDDSDLTDISPCHSRMPIVRPHVFVERMVQARRICRRQLIYERSCSGLFRSMKTASA